ncbi:hypothetical protein KEM52_001795 [Ascosphaera acerosa]|nr:hypothetical protein KEM52_001795 [Ascosphaera acerosa]
MALKIIVIGSVSCALREVFTKLAKLHAKQGFAFAIVAGDLFGDCSSEESVAAVTALLSGNIAVPLPTYFTVGKKDLPARIVERLERDGEVCPNLFYLGRRGFLKTSEGVTIASLGGVLQQGQVEKPGEYAARYITSDASSNIGRSADILITGQWPRDIQRGSNVSIPDGVTVPAGEQCIAELCSSLKPRYHFSAEADCFYEREPFFHLPTEDEPDRKHITRFINVASFGNAAKQKWLYAFTLDTSAPLPLIVPTGTTVIPLVAIKAKRPLASQNETFSRFARVSDDRPTKKPRRPPAGPAECFFCLSNPNVETHLIASIGQESYVTIAKGPLSTATTFPALGFPGHMLIVPFSHSPTFQTMDSDETRTATLHEMMRFQHGLHFMIGDKSLGKLGSVTWEISRWNGVHIHWQLMPVPASLIADGLVESAFRVEAENSHYPPFEQGGSNTPEVIQGDYFRVMITNPATQGSQDAQPEQKCLVLPLTSEFRFDLQFGRRVMAKLLQLEARLNWRDASQSKEDESRDADALKEAFRKYDFSLEDA